VVLLEALDPPEPDWDPVLVLADALAPPDPAWLPVVVDVLADAEEAPDDPWPEDVDPDAAFVWSAVALLAVDWFAVAPPARFAGHHRDVDAFVELPAYEDPAEGIALAAVFDELCVLDVPPLAVG
jgi:hypothetical protein